MHAVLKKPYIEILEVKSKSEWLLKCLAASVSGYEKKKSSESSEKMEKEYNKSLYYTAGM
jgi:hypothetical protein